MKFALLACLLLTGCISSRKNTDVFTVTTRTLGIDISQDQQSGFYHLRLGFITTQLHRAPTSTNAIFAPKLYSSISVGQKLMSTQIDEDYALGDGVDQIDNSATDSPAKLGAAARKPIK